MNKITTTGAYTIIIMFSIYMIAHPPRVPRPVPAAPQGSQCAPVSHHPTVASRAW
jgi:hypothetical protein